MLAVPLPENRAKWKTFFCISELYSLLESILRQGITEPKSHYCQFFLHLL